MRKTPKLLFFFPPLSNVKEDVKGRMFSPSFLLKTGVLKFRRKISKNTFLFVVGEEMCYLSLQNRTKGQ